MSVHNRQYNTGSFVKCVFSEVIIIITKTFVCTAVHAIGDCDSWVANVSCVPVAA